MRVQRREATARATPRKALKQRSPKQNVIIAVAASPSRQRHANAQYDPPQTGEARTSPAHQATAEHRSVELVQSSQPAAAKGGKVLCPAVTATASSDSHSARRATTGTCRKCAPPISHCSVCHTYEMAMRTTGADASGEGRWVRGQTAARVASKVSNGDGSVRSLRHRPPAVRPFERPKNHTTKASGLRPPTSTPP